MTPAYHMSCITEGGTPCPSCRRTMNTRDVLRWHMSALDILVLGVLGLSVHVMAGLTDALERTFDRWGES